MGKITKTDFKVFNGTDYDIKYFSTSADQVSFDAGSGSQADLQAVVTQLRTQDASMAQQLGRLPKIDVIDLYLPADQLNQDVHFTPPAGYDARQVVVIPVGYYTGSRTGAALTVYGLLDSLIFNSPGRLNVRTIFDGGTSSVVVRFNPPADVGAVTVRLLLLQAYSIVDDSAPLG